MADSGRIYSSAERDCQAMTSRADERLLLHAQISRHAGHASRCTEQPQPVLREGRKKVVVASLVLAKKSRLTAIVQWNEHAKMHLQEKMVHGEAHAWWHTKNHCMCACVKLGNIPMGSLSV